MSWKYRVPRGDVLCVAAREMAEDEGTLSGEVVGRERTPVLLVAEVHVAHERIAPPLHQHGRALAVGLPTALQDTAPQDGRSDHLSAVFLTSSRSELSTWPLSAAVRPRSRLDVRVRVGVGDGAVTQVRSMPCSAVVGLQQAELRMTQPMASLLANMRLARRLAPRNRRRCAASCVSARLRPQATPPLGGTTQWGGSKLPPRPGGRPLFVCVPG